MNIPGCVGGAWVMFQSGRRMTPGASECLSWRSDHLFDYNRQTLPPVGGRAPPTPPSSCSLSECHRAQLGGHLPPALPIISATLWRSTQIKVWFTAFSLIESTISTSLCQLAVGTLGISAPAADGSTSHRYWVRHPQLQFFSNIFGSTCDNMWLGKVKDTLKVKPE